MTSHTSDVKITVLRRFSPEEVFKKPPVKAKYSGPCDIIVLNFKSAQVINYIEIEGTEAAILKICFILEND